MTKAQATTILRQQLQDVVAEEYDDTTVGLALDAALQDVETEVLKLDREAVVSVFYRNLTINNRYYEVPEDFLYEHEIQIGATSQDLDGSAVERTNPRQLRGVSLGVGNWHYSRRGRVITIDPVPTETIVNGLTVVYTPALVWPVSKPLTRLVAPLHWAIIDKAKLRLVGQTKESMKDIRDSYNETIANLPLWYLKTADQQPGFYLPDSLVVDGR